MASARTFTAYKPIQKEVHLEKIRACGEVGEAQICETKHEFTQRAGDADLVVTSSPQGHGSSSLYLLCRDGTTILRGRCRPWHYTRENTEFAALKLACCGMGVLSQV